MRISIESAGLIVAAVLMLGSAVAVVVGLVQQLRLLGTQIHQEWRTPTRSSDPELADRAQDSLTDGPGERRAVNEVGFGAGAWVPLL